MCGTIRDNKGKHGIPAAEITGKGQEGLSVHSGFKNLDEYLSRYEKFIISTHESPDADGIGAELAFHELLQALGKKSLILNSDPLPDTLEFLDIDREIHIIDGEDYVPHDIDEHAQIVLDEGGDSDKFETNFIRAEASSTSEIIYEIISYYNRPLTFKSAQAIYTGMLFDTGSFRYPKTTPQTYRIAAHCVELGANPFRIYEHLYESNSLSSFALRSHILSTMEVLENGRMIAMKLTPEMLRKTGASFSEGEPVINVPLTVKGVVASILVKQDIVGPVKVSMRTKGDIDVARLAMDMGGGGHKNAAGYKSRFSFDKTYERAIKCMAPFFT
jgi:phosphoesterase RecJ-like protein